jgi:hypothetical protein
VTPTTTRTVRPPSPRLSEVIASRR